MEIALSQDQISKYADKILLYTNTCMKELRRLFLVQDLVDSLKVCVAVPRSDIYYLLPAIRQLLDVFSPRPACLSVCCSDVAADLRGRSLQRPDAAHLR